MPEYDQEQQLDKNIKEQTTRNMPISLDPQLAKWILEGDETIMGLISKFYGFTYDPARKEIIQKQPMMNDYGIQVMVDCVLSASAHKGIFLSSMDNESYVLANQTLDDMLITLMARQEEFGIKDRSMVYIIMNMLRNNIVSNFKRPHNESDKEFIRGFVDERTVVNQGEKRGFGLFGFGK